MKQRKTVAVSFCLRVPGHWRVSTVETLLKSLIHELEGKRKDPITNTYHIDSFVALHKNRIEVFDT